MAVAEISIADATEAIESFIDDYNFDSINELKKENINISISNSFVENNLQLMMKWNYDKWPGEALAVREFMGVHGDAYDMIQVRNARQPSLVLKKVR